MAADTTWLLVKNRFGPVEALLGDALNRVDLRQLRRANQAWINKERTRVRYAYNDGPTEEVELSP